MPSPLRSTPLLLALAALALPVRADVPDPGELLEAVNVIGVDAVELPGAAGLGIAVGHGNEILLAQGYGFAEVEHGAVAGTNTMFRIGSVTKQFTAAAIMRLVEEGKIELDADIRTYLPDYPTQGHVVTVRNLLTHTGGMKSYTGVPEFWKEGAMHELPADELLAYGQDEPYEFEPGARFAYNNTGYYLLGVIIEKVTGTPYREHIRTLLDPAGLEKIRYDSNTEVIRERAQGYRVEDGQLVNDAVLGMSNPGAAGGLLATAAALVEWQMALTRGEIVSPESYEAMTTPYMLPDGSSTGYGFGLNVGEFEGHRTVRHGGGIFGFNSVLAYYPDEQIHIAVISNCEGLRAQDFEKLVARAALGIEAEENPGVPLAAGQRPRYEGTYDLVGSGLKVRVFTVGEDLMAQASGQPSFRLVHDGDGAFHASFDESVTLEFAADGEGPIPSFVLTQSGRQITGQRIQPRE
jgi:CubicO group peptidase (beta-lactamase class C family)